jgi:hypothetical protein
VILGLRIDYSHPKVGSPGSGITSHGALVGRSPSLRAIGARVRVMGLLKVSVVHTGYFGVMDPENGNVTCDRTGIGNGQRQRQEYLVGATGNVLCLSALVQSTQHSAPVGHRGLH